MPSKPKKQSVLGVGADVAEAFDNAVPNKKNQGKGVVQTLERPARTTSMKLAEDITESTGGGWIAIPTAYVEARDFKKESNLAGKRGKVFRFIKQ